MVENKDCLTLEDLKEIFKNSKGDTVEDTFGVDDKLADEIERTIYETILASETVEDVSPNKVLLKVVELCDNVPQAIGALMVASVKTLAIVAKVAVEMEKMYD